jgi:hypothetical protein
MGASDATLAGRTTTNRDADAASEAENVLVLADASGGTAEACCAERRSASPGTGPPDALLVSLDGTRDGRLDAVVRYGCDHPTNDGVLRREGTRGTRAGRPARGPEPRTTPVSSPGDLAGLGVRIERALSARADGGDPLELRFRSLTALCRHLDGRAAFRLCHAVTRHLAAVGAGSHFHIDPGVVDERTVATLSALFDRVEDRT